MDEDEKPPELSISWPAPAKLQDALTTDHDPRVAAVLRAVLRAKSSRAMSPSLPRRDDVGEPPVRLGSEVQALREEMATKAEEEKKALAAASLDARSVKESVATLRCNVTDLERSVTVWTQTHQHASRGVERQVSALVALHAEWKRGLRNWAVVVSIVLGSCVAVAARAYWIARDTHDVLQQILEANEAKAPAAKGTKR